MITFLAILGYLLMGLLVVIIAGRKDRSYVKDDIMPFAFIFFWPFILMIMSVMIGPKKISYWLSNLVDNLDELTSSVTARWQKIKESLKSGPKSKSKFRDKLRYLLLGTWGQSILGAPLWTWLLGWKLAALNIILCWAAWKFGRRTLIDQLNNQYASKSPQEAIDSIRLFQEDELFRHINSLDKTLQELRNKRGKIREKVTYTAANIPADDYLRSGFRLALERLAKISSKTEEKIKQLEEVLKTLNADRDKLNSSLELLELHRFIETVAPQELDDDTAKIIADTYRLMDGCRQMIEIAGKSEARSLAADPEIPVDRIAERLDSIAPQPPSIRQKALA